MALNPGEIVGAVFSGLAILPGLGLGVVCVQHLNKGKDPVRSGFRWLSSAAFLLFIYAALYFTYILATSVSGWAFRVYTHLGAFTALARHILNILLLVIIVKLGAGHLTLWDHAPALRRWALHGVYAVAVIIGAMTLATSIAQQIIPQRSLNDLHKVVTVNAIRRSLEIVFFAAFAAALGFSVYVLRAGRKAGHETRAARLVVVASALVFLCAIADFAFACFGFTAPTGNVSYNTAMEISRKSTVFIMTATVAEFTTLPAAIAVLYVAGKCKVGGLWSTEVQGDSESDVGKERGQASA